MEKFINFLWDLLQKVWEIEPTFYVKIAAIVIIVVFIATFISNHYLRWKCYRFNVARGDVIFEIKDSVSGFKMKPIPLKREKVPFPMRQTLSSQIAAIVWKRLVSKVNCKRNRIKSPNSRSRDK